MKIEIWVLVERWHKGEFVDYPDVSMDAYLKESEVRAEIVSWGERCLERARQIMAENPTRIKGAGICGKGNHRLVYASLRPDGTADPASMKEGRDWVGLCEIDYVRTLKDFDGTFADEEDDD